MEPETRKRIGIGAGIFLICAAGVMAGVGGRKQQTEETAESTLQDLTPKLSEQEQQAVELLFETLEEGKIKEGAAILVEQEELFGELFYETLGGKRWMYDGRRFQENIQGNGMVLTSSAAVFKGSFQEGRPQGNGLALQAFCLEKPRYDYATGFWEQGRMNGQGEIGYCYYEGAPQGEIEEVSRSGNFKEDRMDGMAVYTTFSGQEGKTSWELQIQEGKIVMDDRWTYDEEEGDFHLPSKQGEGKVYAVSAEEIEEGLWGNLLVWGEEET